MVVQEEGAASELPVLAAITKTHQAANGREDVLARRPWDVLEGARRESDTHTLWYTDWLCTSGQKESLFLVVNTQDREPPASSSWSPFSFQITCLPSLLLLLLLSFLAFVDSPATCLDNLAFPSRPPPSYTHHFYFDFFLYPPFYLSISIPRLLCCSPSFFSRRNNRFHFGRRRQKDARVSFPTPATLAMTGGPFSLPIKSQGFR